MTTRRTIAILAASLCVAGLLTLVPDFSQTSHAAQAPAEGAPAPAPSGPVKTLLVTGGPIHDGKGIGDLVEETMKKSGLFDVTRAHEDLDAFLADRIAPFDLVVFYYTLGELKEAQKRGLMNHIAAGKGYVTFHSGADSFRGDPDYQMFVGGYFKTHPHYRQYQVSITENDSPITKGIEEFMITDEQYILDYDPRVTVLANALYKGKLMPAMWTKPWGKGKVFYLALGHDVKACQQDMFKKLLLRGSLWAAGRPVVDPK